jgi:hypothetical protein
MGSGSLAAMAVFERGWRAGMTVSFSVYVFFMFFFLPLSSGFLFFFFGRVLGYSVSSPSGPLIALTENCNDKEPR